MNSQIKLNLLKVLSNKKSNKGFTLIELLVVVVIVGVLAAIALPNLLGQVGKARESEAKSTLGTLNRTQQTFFNEKTRFATSAEELEVPTGKEKFYNIDVAGAGTVGGEEEGNTDGIHWANGKDNANKGTRDYVSAVQYDSKNRAYSTIVCRAGAGLKADAYVFADAADAISVVSDPGLIALEDISGDSADAMTCDTTGKKSEEVEQSGTP